MNKEPKKNKTSPSAHDKVYHLQRQYTGTADAREIAAALIRAHLR